MLWVIECLGSAIMRDTLLEREFEVRALERALGELGLGRGGVVVVEASAGLGKTTLIQQAGELAAKAGFTLLSARGAELERDFAFGVARQLFEPALPRAGGNRVNLFTGAARATESLFTAANVAGGPSSGSHGASDSVYPLLNGLYWLLVNLAETAPVVMLVDDAQWADSLSLRFLGFLARRLGSVAVTVIVASGSGSTDGGDLLDDLLTASGATVLEPKGLSESAVAELVRRTLGRDADEEFCAACHAVTAGNPLFVRELLRVLAASGTYPDAAAVASVRAAGPDAVRRHVMARLRRQPWDVRDVARAVAVLGDDTELTLVARQAGLTPPSAAAEAAGKLVHCGIFERGNPPAFVNEIMRDVVLSAIPAADRQAAHERAALILQEAGEPVARVASHLLRAAPDGDPGRVSVLLAAAHQARKRGSPSLAAGYLLRARSEPPPAEMRSEVSRLLGTCQAQHLALADAEFHLREAFSLADSPLQWVLCAYSLARFRNGCGAPGEAVDLLAQAIADLPAEQGALLTELEAELIGFTRADLTRRGELLDRLADFQRRPGRPDVIIDAQLSVEAAFSGAPASDVAGLARRALAGDHLPPDKSAIWAAVHMLIVADEFDEVERRLAVALNTAVSRGHLFPIALVRAYLSRVSLLRGDLAQAREHAELGAQGLSGPNLALPALRATQIDLLVEDGRLAEADVVAQDAIPSASRELSHVWQLLLLSARARLRAAQGRPGDALADAMTCGELYQQWGAARLLDVPWRLQAAEAHRRLGDRERAAALVAEHLGLARSFGVARHIGVALCEAAMLASDRAEASRLLREATGLLQDSPARLELARALELLGTILLEDGNHQEGWASVRRSAELAAQCRAPVMAERLRVLLAGSGTRPPLPHLTGIRALTSSERQVAQLAADGLTNRQIAEKLFLSEKTVEAHLSRSYRKLGVRTRTQLAVRMAVSVGG
jgi:DNA-binding NarL/FixJ family response regulator